MAALAIATMLVVRGLKESGLCQCRNRHSRPYKITPSQFPLFHVQSRTGSSTFITSASSPASIGSRHRAQVHVQFRSS